MSAYWWSSSITFTRATVIPATQAEWAISPAATGSKSTANRPKCCGAAGLPEDEGVKLGTTPRQAGSFWNASRFSSGWMIGSSRASTSNRSRSAPDRFRTLMIVLFG